MRETTARARRGVTPHTVAGMVAFSWGVVVGVVAACDMAAVPTPGGVTFLALVLCVLTWKLFRTFRPGFSLLGERARRHPQPPQAVRMPTAPSLDEVTGPASAASPAPSHPLSAAHVPKDFA